MGMAEYAEGSSLLSVIYIALFGIFRDSPEEVYYDMMALEVVIYKTPV